MSAPRSLRSGTPPLHPNYRFTPMKRADKDRMHEEKRQAKEQERAGRVSPYALPPPTASSSTPLIAQPSVLLPNSKTAALPVSSPSSPSSADIALLRHGHGSTTTHAPPSHDSYADPRDDSQSASSRASSYSRTDIPFATPLPAVPTHLLVQLSTPQTLAYKGWKPSQSDPPSFLSPLQEFPPTDWPQSAPWSNEAPPQLEARADLLRSSFFLTIFCL
ncbi:hypothetical protein H4582DRAFT_2087774 [Lactarius indigo]|nr:hypothetical protein H4582DRAFT_2087774 [Lactarius indigo]